MLKYVGQFWFVFLVFVMPISFFVCFCVVGYGGFGDNKVHMCVCESMSELFENWELWLSGCMMVMMFWMLWLCFYFVCIIQFMFGFVSSF